MTQADPIDMVAYVIDVLLLIKLLKTEYSRITQPCNANNAGTLGMVENIKL